MPLPNDFPTHAGAARNAYILAAIADGRIVPVWVPLRVQAGWHDATFYVLADALKLNGVRLSTSAYNLQQIADRLGASLITPRLIDWAFLHASIVIPPLTSTPDDSVTSIERESSAMDHAILAASGGLGASPIPGETALVAPIGKNWVLSNVLIGAKAHDGSIAAALYGWAVAHGFKPPPGVSLHKGTLPGIQNIQPLATPHNISYVDYAMLASLVRRDCIVDGVQRDLWDVLRDPSLSALVSHEGPLRILRQPGVPVLPALAPPQQAPMGLVATMGADFWAASPGVRHPPLGRPLAPGVVVQLLQQEQHVAQRQQREREHPIKSDLSKFFWHIVSIPLTTILGVTIGKLIEKRKAGRKEEP